MTALETVPPNAQPPVFLNTEGAAARLALRPKTLRNWRALNNDGPPYLKLGSSVRYSVQALDAWALAKVA